MKSSRDGLLRWIAVFKLVKALLMIAVGVGILRLAHNDSEGTLDRWVSTIGLDPGRGYIDAAIGKVASLSPARLRSFGLGSFVYAGLFLTEGIGLWLRKKWAEWFTTILTASLLPLEIYELHRHPTIGKALALLVNLAVVVYLVKRIRRESSAHALPECDT